MVEIVLVILGIVMFVGFAFILFVINQRMHELKNDSGAQLLKQDITNLSIGVSQLKDGLQQQLSVGLDKTNHQMVQQFQESAKIIRDVTQKLTELDKTNQHVGTIAADLKILQNVLQNPKQRGGVGEFYLQTVLENVLPPGIFQLQYAFSDGEKIDAAIFLDKKILPVDSKFSLENYNRLIEETNAIRREALITMFKSDVKKRIDETAKYIRPNENTTDFAFMFIPSEAIYYDLLVNKIGAAQTSSRDLIEYAFRDKKVIIVSPTTMLAYLQTVMQGLRSLKIEEQAKDIQKRVSELGRHLSSYEVFMQKLGNSLGTSVNHFNNAHKELGKIDKDIVRIADSSPGIEPLLITKPEIDQ